jgi:hypothetical protein
MPFLHAYQRCACRGLILGIGLLALWGWLCAPARAQDNVYYSRYRNFQIPFNLDQADQRIQHVNLHVSRDLGGHYEQVGSAAPSERSFRFLARADGWHWFVVQIQESDGRFTPPNPRLVQPGLRVCVDTLPPRVVLRPIQPREGTVGVEWEVQDENLDLLTLALDYRPVGSDQWIPLNVRQLAEGQFSWSPSGAASYQVRLRVLDKAGNPGESRVSVTPLSTAAAAPGVPGPGGNAPPPPGPRSKVIHVRSKTFQLNYTVDAGTVGPSAVKNVEVWLTSDTRTWTQYSAEAPPRGPYKVTVLNQGRFGFSLRPRSGVGLADDPPRPGDQPQIWVEVDEEIPQVKILDVQVGTGADTGKLTVHWNASDKFLRPQPITISWAAAPTGPWNQFATKLDNTGIFTGRSDPLPYEFYLKVEAIDEAGNIGQDHTTKPIKVDLKIPRISTVDVIGVEAVPTAPPGAPPAPANPPGGAPR